MEGIGGAVFGLVQLLGVGLVLAVLLGSLLTAWRLTHPARRTYADAVRLGKPGDPGELDDARAFVEARYATRWGELIAWEIVGDAADGPVLVYAHGWARVCIGIR